MSKIYYGGEILNVDDLLSTVLNLGDMEHFGYSENVDQFLKYLYTLKIDKIEEFSRLIKNTIPNEVIKLSSPELNEIKSTINHIISGYNKGTKILFEIITSESGDLYGKELLTGLLFPLTPADKIEYKLMKSNVNNAILSEQKKILFFIESHEKPYQVGISYDCSNYFQKNNIYYIKDSSNGIFYSYGDHRKYFPINFVSHSLTPIIRPFENLSLCKSIVFTYKVADKNEIEKYTHQFKGLFKNSSKRKFLENITTQYNKNIFNSVVTEKEQKIEIKKNKVEKDKMTLKLENIEYLLSKLKNKNHEAYEELQKEYNELIDSENKTLTLTPITIETLTILEGKIEFSLSYSKNKNNDIFSLLEDLKKEYLDNFKSEEDKTTKLTLAEIDKLYELFLKTKQEYALKSQTKILKDIAFLYIMETIEDEDIKIKDLENSYFIDHLKYIMMVIMSLIDDDIIKDDILINLDDELNIYNIYNIIKNIEFKKQKQKKK